MSGTITHSWNGTILTVTSDSGTSSADLKGEKGDTGIRGAQGAEGKVDTSKVYTIEKPPTTEEIGAVPTTRIINNHILDKDINLNAADVGARDANWLPTAEEIGARDNNWLPSAAEVGAVPTTRKVNDKELSADITLTAADVGAKDINWLPTIGDIGAAPSGYGLGVTSSAVPSDLNNAINGGFYCFGSSTLNRPSRMNEGAVIVASREANWLVQIACSTYDYTSGSGILAVRRCLGSSGWSEWEYINPPMITGIEYRTTERYNGKPVYTKLVNLGALPARNSNIHVATGITATKIVRAALQMSDGSLIPYGYNREIISFGVSTATINVYTADNEYAEYADKTGTAQLWYIKD